MKTGLLNSANDVENLRMAEGLGKGAGVALLAVTMPSMRASLDIQGAVNHLQVCPVLGRNSAHTMINSLSHLVVQNGVINAAKVETDSRLQSEGHLGSIDRHD